MAEKQYLIFAPEHHAFWRLNRHGYTRNPDEALKVPIKEALLLTNEPYVDDFPVPDKPDWIDAALLFKPVILQDYWALLNQKGQS